MRPPLLVPGGIMFLGHLSVLPSVCPSPKSVNVIFYQLFVGISPNIQFQWDDMIALLAEQWTCNSQVTGSRHGWTSLHSGLGQATYTCVPLSPSSIIWCLPRWVIALAEKVTTGLLKKWQPTTGFMTNVTCRLTAKKPGSALESSARNQVWNYFTLTVLIDKYKCIRFWGQRSRSWQDRIWCKIWVYSSMDTHRVPSTLCLKQVDHQLMAITLSVPNWFSKFFDHCKED